ncbi:MAG: hypothetical protein INR66_17945 [Gordonia polyisoprenivorans]|nr:hypothetical protein [Gordonia polyisoprenivorans]
MFPWRPPVNEIPVRVSVAGVVNRTPTVVIWLSETHVFTTGVVFRFEVRTRDRRGAQCAGGLRGEGGPVLVGFEWADGTTSTNLPEPHNNAGGLSSQGSSSGGSQASLVFGLDHLPPPGRCQLITAWPSRDVPEHAVKLDATPIAAAARAVDVLWDDAAEKSIPAPSDGTDSPAVPPGGWFADHYDPSPLPLRPEHGARSGYDTGVVSLPRSFPADWVDGAPTSGKDQSCVFCGGAYVDWVHPLDEDKISYRAWGKGHTLPTYWMLCERCEQTYQAGDDDAAITVMKRYWLWNDVNEDLRKPLHTFRRADKGARPLSG